MSRAKTPDRRRPVASILIEKMEKSPECAAVSVYATVADERKPRSYYLWVNVDAVTVVYEPDNRRHLGRTYFGRDDVTTTRELQKGYKRDGATLADLTRQARALLTG